MFELIHTSAESGLFGAHPGYTVVAATEGLPGEVVRALCEGSTAAVTRLGHGVDPEPFAVYRIWQATPRFTVVSRIVPIEADYTGRPARLSHHAVLPREEARGPVIAALLAEPSIFADSWQGPPRSLPARKAPTAGAVTDETEPSVVVEQLTDHALRWERHLAAESTQARARPLGVLVPSTASLRMIVAAIVRHCGDAGKIRIETSLDHLVSSNPSLVLIRDRSARTVGIEVGADWSRGRGTTAPPEDAATRPAPASAIRRDGPPELGALPQPTAIITSWRRASGASPGDDLEPESWPVVAEGSGAGTSVGEAMACYATGVLAGGAIALVARAVVP